MHIDYLTLLLFNFVHEASTWSFRPESCASATTLQFQVRGTPLDTPGLATQNVSFSVLSIAQRKSYSSLRGLGKTTENVVKVLSTVRQQLDFTCQVH